ncbi:uncharacterized protein MAM_01226 [Metarhizium album ARSEF 1941]|uniref:Uncharacterized protein n=1 Tax=Metarhizium album (strain ARSEF 1941) TaxID=1081103 RepID=A0A0B2X3W6_METAS|nr:uncharacterized protein MAM_01226 [Metarhizium album ARSEF 1941]KHO00448.1 hypothetical protein MAM_01226 [Metarhizium album ARSEF 1941]
MWCNHACAKNLRAERARLGSHECERAYVVKTEAIPIVFAEASRAKHALVLHDGARCRLVRAACDVPTFPQDTQGLRGI